MPLPVPFLGGFKPDNVEDMGHKSRALFDVHCPRNHGVILSSDVGPSIRWLVANVGLRNGV